MQFSNIGQSLICPIFSPCAKYFITVNNQNIYIKDASYLDLKNHAQILLKDIKNASSLIIKFSPNSQLIAVKFTKKVEVYDIHGKLKIRIQDQNYEVQNIIWSQDPSSYQLLVFYKDLLHCHIHNLKDGVTSIIKNPKFTNQKGCTFSKGQHHGIYMAMLQRQGMKDSVGIYFTKTWQLMNYITIESSFDIAEVQFTVNGNLVLIEKFINFKLFIANPFLGVIEEYGDKSYVMGFCCHKVSNTSTFLALGAYDNCIHILNTATWKLICEIEMTQEIDLSKTLWFREQNNKFCPVQGAKGKVPKKEVVQEGEGGPGISLLQFSPNDQFLAVKIDTMANSVFVYSIRHLELISVVTLAKNVKDFKWIQNEHNQVNLCIASGASTLLFWRNTEGQDSIHEIVIPTATNSDIKIGKIQQGKDKKFIFYSNQMKKFVYALP